MVDFIANLSEWQLYGLLLLTFTVMAAISRGTEALKPTRGGAYSAVINFAYLKSAGLVFGVFGFLVLGASEVYDGLGLPSVPEAFWADKPFWLVALAVLFVYDFGIYWAHRALHRGWLWPMHAIHHSDRHMHFLTWSRGHPLEQMFIAVCLVFSSTWLGLGFKDIAGIALLRAFSQYYVHSNIDWDHGPLKYVFVSPRLHRWHHVDHPDAYDKNFSSIFSIFDVMFGTYYNPHSAVDMPTGVPELPSSDIVKLYTHPFTEWARMLREKLGGSPRETDIAEAADA